MATVFRATDEQLGRTVAVKVFPPGVADAVDDARRASEMRLLASLNHPSLVTLFDAKVGGQGSAYLVMEYVDGETLDERIQRGPVDPRDAASLAADIGEALHVVHRAGIIHRDVKPSNILMRPPLSANHSFRATLADFGIAYLVDTTRVTATGTAIGTAAYIAPEQARGAAPTPASDVYALGLVLIEALTGRRAFAGHTPVESIAARLSVSPEIPHQFGQGWYALLTAMTAIDPEGRPAALEVSTRGRVLDADGGGAETRTVPVVGDNATRVMPSHGDDAATTPYVPGAAAASAAAASAPTLAYTPTPAAVPTRTEPMRAAAVDTPATRKARTSRAKPIALTVAIVGLLFAIFGIIRFVDAVNPPQPDLPVIGEPLDTNLQQLLDEVTP